MPPYALVISLVGLLFGVIALARPDGCRGVGLWYAIIGTLLSLFAAALCVFLMPGWWSHPWPVGAP